MATIIQYTQNFIKGTTSKEYDVPPPVQIAICIAAAVLLTIVVAILHPLLKTSKARNSYMWYYFVGIFNLINICLFLWFYYRKTTNGDLIGDAGDPGVHGVKGSGGPAANCSLCQTNLYIQPVQKSAVVSVLDLDTLTAASLGPQLPSAVQQLADSSSHTLFDYSSMIDQLLIGGVDGDQNTGNLDNIQIIAEHNEYTLLSYLNNVHGISAAPVLHRTDLSAGTIGYLALGDSMTSSSGVKPQSYVINGDIRATDVGGYEVRGQITTATIQSTDPTSNMELNSSSRYNNVPKTIKPTTYQILKPKSIKGYDAIGELIVPVGSNPSRLHYAMASTDCLEIIPSSQLRLAYVYPLTDGSGYLSFWDTGFGTWHTKRTNIMQLPESQHSGSDNSSNNNQSDNNLRIPLYKLIQENTKNTQNTTRIESPKELTQRLAAITIPKYVTAATILGHTIEYTQFNIGNILQDHWPIISTAITPLQLQKLKEHKQRPQNITPNDIPEILSILGPIATSITPTTLKNAKLTKKRNPSTNVRKTVIKSLYDLGTTGRDLDTNPSNQLAMSQYKLSQDYERMRVSISDAGVQIENVSTLLELVLVLTGLRTDGDVGKHVHMADLSPTTTRVLAICAALIPPNDRVFRPKDTCLVSTSLDTKRISMVTKLQQAMQEYQRLLSSSSVKSDDPNIVQQVNMATEKAFEDLAVVLGSVSDYMTKIQNGSFDEFSDRRIQEATAIFKKLNQKITI